MNYKCFILIFIFKVFSANAQPLLKLNNSSLLKENAVTSSNNNKSLYLKYSLLYTIQDEFCYWNHPKAFIETNIAAVDKIKAYWATINVHPTTKQIVDSNWQKRNPWSAAFISWCMKNAGFDSTFKYAPNHAEYIVWAKQNRERKDSSSLFWAYNTTDSAAAWPKVGDLLCKNRSGKKFALSTICPKCISHCDIILETDYANGIVTTIGGNVLNKVNKRWVFLDQNGFIDKNAKWLCYDVNGNVVTEEQEQFFAVIKLF
jgi:hypothetical protein